jgi:O-glycosyl hydrolase
MKKSPVHYLPDFLSSFPAVEKAGLKNKWLRVTGALVMGMVLSAGLAVAQPNLVNNPGFETGNTSGWSPFGSCTIAAETSQVNSGTYAAQVTGRTATYMGISQSFVGALQAGQTYNVSAWVRLFSGSQTMQLTMQKTDGSGTSYAAMASGSVSSAGWTQLSGQYTYNPSGSVTALNFYAEVTSSSNASYYIDDVVLSGGTVVTNSSTNGVSIVDWNNVHQRIDGFGASSAWNSTWNTAEADLLFSTNNNISYQSGTYNGVGLSLIRNRIVYANNTLSSTASTTVETQIMQLAQARGARVWSAPWTPAAGFKNTNDIYDGSVAAGGGLNGGSFRGGDATNRAYASQIANYVANMKNTYGVNIYAVSVQNEPDANVTGYEACQWSGTLVHDYVTNLYNALSNLNLSSTKIMLPESQNWTDPHNITGPTMIDPNSAAEVGIIANHNYVSDNSVGDQTSPAAINSYGKALWETEVALLSGSDSSINNGVYYAKRIYLYMTQAQANAYHYWWLVASGSSNEGLLDTSAAPTKRLFTFGQYSRFVRPNNYRIDATSSQSSILVSAYKDTNSAAFAIVVVNLNPSTDVSETFNMTNFTATAVTPWITSASLSLAPQTAVTVTNGSFTYTVPAMSVVTFVGAGVTGQITLPPTLVPVADQIMGVGRTLLVTNVATDAAVPPNTLTFNLLSSPAGSTLTSLNPTNALFSWRAPVSQANTTNVVTVAVTDNTTSLSATDSFNVIVNTVTNPVIGSVSASAGQVSLTVNGPQGPDYTLWTSTDLVSWQSLFTTNSPSIPLTVTDTNAVDPQRFYKFQIGP